MNFYRNSTAVALVLAVSGGMIAANAPANAQNAEECLAKLRQVEQNVEQANLTADEQRQLDRMRQEVRDLSQQGNIERCQVVVSEVEAFVTADTEKERAAIIVQRAQPEVTVKQPQPQVSVQQPKPQITVRQAQPEVTVTQAKPEVTVRVPEPQVTVRMPKPQVTVRQGEPEVTVTQAEPQVSVNQAEPQVQVNQQRPQVSVQMDNPQVNVQQARPEVIFDQPEPKVVVQKQEPEVQVEQQQQAAVQVERSGEPEIRLQQAEPEVAVRQQQPEVRVQQGEPKVRVEQQQADVNVQQQEPQVNVREQQARQGGEAQRDEDSRRLQAMTGENRTLDVGRASERGQDAAAQRNESPLMSMRSEELIGMDVYGARGDQLGDIEHMLLGQDNQVYAVVSVGGFLGIGDHDVALPVEKFEQQGDRLVLSSETESSLESMPDYDEGAAGYEQIERGRRPIDYMR